MTRSLNYPALAGKPNSLLLLPPLSLRPRQNCPTLSAQCVITDGSLLCVPIGRNFNRGGGAYCR